MQRLSDEDLQQRLRSIAGVAAGPWRVVRHEYPQMIADGIGRVVARTYERSGDGAATAAFIAASRREMPRLALDLQAARADLRAARAELARARVSFRLMTAAAAMLAVVLVVVGLV